MPIEIKDKHGLAAKHVLSVRVCDCTTPSECSMPMEARQRDIKVAKVVLGKWAILSMVLGSALLLCKYNYLECVSWNFSNIFKNMTILYINDI